MKSFSNNRRICAFAMYIAVLVAPAALAQIVPEPASSVIPTRGFRGDLSSTDDKFLSLDLNGDGKADMLAYRPGGGYAGVYLSHGDGTFHYISYVDNGTSHNGFPGDLSGTQDTFVALDLNGDGKSDFIEYRPGSGYTIRCLSSGDGRVNCIFLSQPGQQYNGFKDSMTNGAERIVAMDLDHDGRSDFIVYTPGAGYARAYLSLANGNVQEVDLTINGSANTAVGFADDMKPNSVRIVPIDYNGDGYADLLVYTPLYGEVRLYQNTGRNTFLLRTLSYGGSNSNGFTGSSTDTNAHLIALDLNGDGRQDFLWWQAGSRTVIGYLSSGTGTFTAVNYQANGSTANGFQDNDNAAADTAVALDADGDGKQDFFWYSPGNNVATLYLSSATGALNGAVFYGSTLRASANNGVLLPLNFLGQAASGFLSYIPGSGANNGAPVFTAYTLANSDRQSSVLGRLNTYNFYVRPGSFLSDLNWSVGNVPLKEIVMPGTHDSAMYALTDGQNDINETQWSDSLTYQLNAGARALDFRTGYYVNVNSGFYNVDGGIMIIDQVPAQTTNGFYMYGHSNTLSNVPTSASLNQIENWILTHPNEVVVVDLYAAVSGKQRNMTQQFVSLIQKTDHPELIYTPLSACGAASCADPNLQPHNTTIANLLAQGKRMILLSDQIELNSYGWTWSRSNTNVGYCENYEGGRSTSIDEIDCINNASNESGSKGTSINVARPEYRAADAADGFMTLKATLTPGGFARTGQVISLLPPLTLADAGYPYGFNVGGQEYDLRQQMLNGAWSNNALNLWNIDGLRPNDDITRFILQRNSQTWVDMHFFNNRSNSPAGALSIGANGDIWAAGAGHSLTIFKYNPVTRAWVARINGQANVKKLAVDPQGGVWVVDGSQGIASPTGRLIHYDANGQNANITEYTAQDVAVGKNGSVWGINPYGVFEVSGPTDGSTDLRRVYTSQSGSHVAVDNQGFPWVIDNNSYIQKFNGTSWQRVSGAQGREIVAAADGSIFISGYNTPSIGRYNLQNDNFDFLHMDASHIAVEPGGQPWAIRQGTGTVYKGSLDQM